MRSRAPPPPQPTFRAYAIAGKIFHPPHPHTHTHHLIDFINPDYCLLGKKTYCTEHPGSRRSVANVGALKGVALAKY